MLTVSNAGGRSRSKSPGRRDHSRSRAEEASHSKSALRAISPPKSSKSSSSRSKKYHEPSSSDSEEATESDEDDRHSRRKDHDRRDKKDSRRRKTESESSSEDEDEDEEERGYAKHDKHDKHDRAYADGRHPSYGSAPQQYQYAQVAPPPQPARHMSYSERDGKPRNAYEVPGSFRGHDDHDARGTRHMSFVEVEPPGDPRHPKIYQGEHGQPQYVAGGQHVAGGQYVAAAPRSAGERYAPAPKYEYAQPSQSIKYLSKNEVRDRDGQQYYVQTPHAVIEPERHKPARKDSGDKHRSRKDDSDDDDRHGKTSRSSKHKSRQDDSDSESERDKRGKHKSRRDSDSDDRRRSSKYEDHKSGHGHKERPQVVEIRPGQKALTVGNGHGAHRLSVSGGAPGALSLMAPGAMALGVGGQHVLMGGLPPGSPLLEAYHGTYQSISPMPSPMSHPLGMGEDMSDLEPLEGDYSSDSQRRRSKKSSLKKRVEIYDPEPDALAIAAELKHQKGSKALIKILPPLSDDNMMHLRTEYKKHFKVNGKGINIAKHIKMKVQGNIGKAAYATALGRWESEAHWANFWYQSGSSRRELLIESLIGRSNAEIRKIKEAFQDKRYNDSLEKCMQTELKKDKFRNAVLLALQERRQDELAPLSKNQIAEDVRELYKALVSKEGGETAMIDIIVVRSDLHLRQVLREFEAKYKRNFARESIQKSQNLVGETLAHILNGVLNRPVRDAMLMRQALAETSKDRAELLISRLVRFHWEPKHLERIKVAYKQKYGSKLERDVEEGSKGDYGEFCLALCDGATK